MSLRAGRSISDDIAVQRRVPYEVADSSCTGVLAQQASARGWDVQFYDAKDVEARAVGKLGERAGGSCSVRTTMGRRGRRTIGWL
jgi:hypothetical protein